MRLHSFAVIGLGLLVIGSVVQSVSLAQNGPPLAERFSVPAQADRSKAESQIRALFREEILAAKKPADKQALAQKLLKTAGESGDDPNTRYVLLRQAVDLFSEAEDFDGSEKVLEELIERYQVDAWKERLWFVKVSSIAAKRPESRATMLTLAASLSSRAFDEEQFEAAAQILNEAALLASRAKDQNLATSLRKQRGLIGDLQRLTDAANAAKKTLESTPDDAAAHLALGKYLCFVRRDWNAGLPHLAQGNDESLRNLARQELAKPDTVQAHLDLADAWSKFGEKGTGSQRVFCLEHARVRYRLVSNDLAGLDKVRVEKRLAELDAALPHMELVQVARGKVGAAEPAKVRPEMPANPAPEKPRVVAKVEPPEPDKKARPNVPAQPNPDKPFESVRDAIGWCYRMKIYCSVSVGDQHFAGMVDPEKLLPGDPLVHGFEIDAKRNPQSISPQILARLAYFPEITRLTLEGSGVTDQTLAALPEFRLIRSLTLGRNSRITTNGFKLLERFPNLSQLKLNGGSFDELPTYKTPMPIVQVTLESTTVSEQQLKSLAQFPNFTFLQIHDCRFSGDAHSVIPTLGLTILSLDRSFVGDKELSSILPLPSVHSLDFGRTQVTDAGLTSLKEMEKLASVQLIGTAVTDKTIESLAALPNLRGLYLDDTKVTGSGFEKFPENSLLSSLSLRRTQINDQNLKRMPAFANLNVLNLVGAPVTDNGLLAVQKFPALMNLQVSMNTGLAAEQAVKEQLPKLNVSRFK